MIDRKHRLRKVPRTSQFRAAVSPPPLPPPSPPSSSRDSTTFEARKETQHAEIFGYTVGSRETPRDRSPYRTRGARAVRARRQRRLQRLAITISHAERFTFVTANFNVLFLRNDYYLHCYGARTQIVIALPACINSPGSSVNLVVAASIVLFVTVNLPRRPYATERAVSREAMKRTATGTGGGFWSRSGRAKPRRCLCE